MSTALTGTSLRECPGIIKTMQGLARMHMLRAYNMVLTQKKPDVMI